MAAMVASVVLLSYSMRTLPLRTAYTIWKGIGAVGASLVGILLLGETLRLTQIAAAVLTIAGPGLMKLPTLSVRGMSALGGPQSPGEMQRS
jgi:quaternary ammonium compound-resistance protein SugE